MRCLSVFSNLSFSMCARVPLTEVPHHLPKTVTSWNITGWDWDKSRCTTVCQFWKRKIPLAKSEIWNARILHGGFVGLTLSMMLEQKFRLDLFLVSDLGAKVGFFVYEYSQSSGNFAGIQNHLSIERHESWYVSVWMMFRLNSCLVVSNEKKTLFNLVYSPIITLISACALSPHIASNVVWAVCFEHWSIPWYVEISQKPNQFQNMLIDCFLSAALLLPIARKLFFWMSCSRNYSPIHKWVFCAGSLQLR